MTDTILAVQPCPHNSENSTNSLLYQDIPRLAELLKLCYEEYAKRPNIEALAFVAVLKSLVKEYIEPICQKNPPCHAAYQIYRDQLTQYEDGDLKQHSSSILEALAFGMANLVRCAIDSFRALNYPESYRPFLALLEDIFNNDTIIQHGKQCDAYILLEQLRQKP